MLQTGVFSNNPAPVPEKKSRAWKLVKFVFLLLLLAVLLYLSERSAGAQNQTASTRIADAAQPWGILVNPIDCLERIKKIFENADKAANYCKDIYHNGGEIMKQVSNEAADSISKTNFPTVPGGWGYGGMIGTPRLDGYITVRGYY